MLNTCIRRNGSSPPSEPESFEEEDDIMLETGV
jgi:hypothetical protein